MASIVLNPGEVDLRTAVIDTANGYAYFGTNLYVSPARIIKIRLSDFTRVGAITLEPGEEKLGAAVIDPDAGFAYFGTNVWGEPARIIKIDLRTFTRVDAITLPEGEINLRSAVIDLQNGFAYFGTHTPQAKVIKIDLSNFTRVGSITLNSGEEYLDTAVIDPSRNTAYFGVTTLFNPPGKIVKISTDPSDFRRLDVLNLNPTEKSLYSSVIDPDNDLAYFGETTHLIKIRLSTFSREGTLRFRSDEQGPHTSVIDLQQGLVGIALGKRNGRADPAVTPAAIIKVDLASFVEDDALIRLNVGEPFMWCAATPPGGRFAYFGARSSPGRVAKINLSSFTEEDAISMASGEDEIISVAIDPQGYFAYFGTRTSPGRVVKVDLSNFTRVGAITFLSGEDEVSRALMDPAGQFAYFVAGSGKLIKVQLSNFTPVGRLTLGYTDSAAIDPLGEFGYFAFRGIPARVLKVRLSDLTLVDSLTLNPDDGTLQSAVIDSQGSFAYFGSDINNSKVIKVSLSDFSRVGALSLLEGESYLASAVIDSTDCFAYFGTRTLDTAHIVKISLLDFTRVGAIDLTGSETELKAAVFDPTTQAAYWGTYKNPATIIKLDLSPVGGGGSSPSGRQNNLSLASSVSVPPLGSPSLGLSSSYSSSSSFGALRASALSNTVFTLKIYPNPFIPSQGHTQVNFTNLPSGTRIRIYTLSGELVKDMNSDGNGVAVWDGTNQSTQSVASGTYFVLVEANGEKKKFRVAVER